MFGATRRTLSSTVRHGSKRGSWKTIPSRPDNGRVIVPSKSTSSPAMIRRIVVLPQPDGPTRAPTSLCLRSKQISRRTSKRSPDAAVNALCTIRTLRCPGSPAERASFNGLHHCGFDNENDGYKRERIGKNKRHVKQLKGHADLKSYAIRAPEQFDDEHDLPDQRKAGTPRRGEIRSELRQNDVPQKLSSRQGKDTRHFVEAGIESAGTFAHRNHGVRQFVDCDRQYACDLCQPTPDERQHDNH